MSPPTTQPSRFERLWLTETIRLREQHAGLLDDADANRLAMQQGRDFNQRVEQRALYLAQRDGQAQAITHWQQGARLALIALMVVALITGAAMAVAALGRGEQPVNVFWALCSLLGLNLISLVGWMLSSRLLAGSGAVLGRFWLWLSAKLARDAQVAQLMPALMLLLQRQQLLRWGLGALSHGLWSLAMLASLLLLVMLLSTHRYGFVWQTTLLSADSFVGLTHALGSLPALFGFNQPEIDAIRASGSQALSDASARQAWASWLLGVVLVYGLLPRLLLLAVCLWRGLKGLKQLQLDLTAPGFSELRNRLCPASERLGISDSAPDHLPNPVGGQTPLSSQGAVLLGIELDDRRTWPPVTLKHAVDAGILDTREQRQRLLLQLTHYPAERLLIACEPLRSPDRGTLALLAQLSHCAAQTRICLLPPPSGQVLDSQRLGDWHSALGKLNLGFSDAVPLNWLETGHD